MNYLYHLITMIGIYTILSLAANIPVGLVNLLTLAQGAFYGIGAYLSAFILLNHNMPILFALPIVMLVGGVFSLVTSLASIRLKGDYFILSTLSFQLIVFSFLRNWVSVTKGTNGISGIPSPKLFGGNDITSNFQFSILSILLGTVVSFLFYQLSNSPYGRVLKAIRSDELGITVLGRNVNRFKISAFFLSASFTSIGGFLFAGYFKYIDPTSFTLDESIFILSAVFIGGLGNVKGCIMGSVFVILLPELLRFAGLPDTIAPNMRQIIYGFSILIIIRYFPKGIAGNEMLK